MLLLEHYHPRQLEYGTGGPSDPTMLLTLEELERTFPDWVRLHAFEGEQLPQPLRQRRRSEKWRSGPRPEREKQSAGRGGEDHGQPVAEQNV